jgi:hypothetical protein
MLYEDYYKTIIIFKGILKNFPEDNETFKVHFTCIRLKIETYEQFRYCLMEHLKISDWFPTHIDLFIHTEDYLVIKNKKAEDSDPLLAEIKRLKASLEWQNDVFIANKDPALIDRLRYDIHETESKLKKLETKLHNV